MSSYLESTNQQFQYYKNLAERAISALDLNQLTWSPGPESNSIQTIMRHIGGNIRSRWTDFLTTDGEKEWRMRDAEFSEIFETKEDLMTFWEDSWVVLFNELGTLSDDELETTVYIRAEPHSVTKAVQRQLAHKAYHIGQIVYLAKLLQGDCWDTLTIPLGGSDDFNKERTV
jgi:hypothetical protein